MRLLAQVGYSLDTCYNFRTQIQMTPTDKISFKKPEKGPLTAARTIGGRHERADVAPHDDGVKRVQGDTSG